MVHPTNFAGRTIRFRKIHFNNNIMTLQFIQDEASPRAVSIIEKKLSNLGRKYDWIILAEVFLRNEPPSDGKGKICEIRLSVPGPVLFASSNEPSYEMAAAETIRDLERQLKYRKEKWEPQNYSNN